MVVGFEEAWGFYLLFQGREKKGKRRLVEAVVRPVKLEATKDGLDARLAPRTCVGRQRGSQAGWTASREEKESTRNTLQPQGWVFLGLAFSPLSPSPFLGKAVSPGWRKKELHPFNESCVFKQVSIKLVQEPGLLFQHEGGFIYYFFFFNN